MAVAGSGVRWAVGICVLAAACAAPGSERRFGVTQDIDFLRGCWVMKKDRGGEVLAFLRLLPPTPGAATLEGEVQVVSERQPRSGTRFVFARDGSSVIRTSDRETALYASGPYTSVEKPPVSAIPDFTPSRSIEFLHRGSPSTFLHIDHYTSPDAPETVLIRVRNADTDALEPPISTDFAGERDGCD